MSTTTETYTAKGGAKGDYTKSSNAQVNAINQARAKAASSGTKASAVNSIGRGTVNTPTAPVIVPQNGASLPSPTASPSINTTQPSPTTASITPPNASEANVGTTGAISPAQDAVDKGIVKTTDEYNNAVAGGQELAARMRQGLANINASGAPAPDTQGQANMALAGATPPPPTDTSNIDAALAEDKGYQQLLKDQADYNHALNQQKSLTDTYKELTKSAGIDEINTELLNAKKVIDGTEDDIRAEVQAVSGFATDSQVMALSSARNKTLIKNYNNLLDAKSMAMEQVTTMIGLAKEDQATARQNIIDKMGIDEKLMTYRDKFVSNAKEGYNNVIKAIGYDGLYKSLANSGDPTALSLAERTLGLTPGMLGQAATTAAVQTAQANTKADLQNKVLESNLLTDKYQRANIQSEINARNLTGSGVDAESVLAYAQQYASDGKIPTGLPKGTFGLVSQVAKELPKPDGTLVSISTGIKPDKLSSTQYDGIVALKDLTQKLDQAKTMFNGLQSKGQTGLASGLLGGIFPTKERQEYQALTGEITDLLARARTGAAITAYEEAQYASKLPTVFNQSLWMGGNGSVKIDALKSSLTGKLDTTLKTNGVSIYGYSTVKVGDQEYKVGDVISNGTQQGRVNPDGTITILQ